MPAWSLPQQREFERREPGFVSPPEILVVESDFSTRHEIVEYLGEHQMRAVAALGRDDLLSRLTVGEPRLLILDLQSGRHDGLDLLREVRSCSAVPVITTGHASDKIDPVIGFEIGADDYLRKPFGLRELLARIRAILRRTPETRSAATQDVRFGRYRFSGWQLCERTRHLTNPSGNRVFLSNGEFTLLVAFLGAPQRPLSRLALWQATRVHVGASDRSMDVQILRLRRKLTTDRDAPCLIRTERGFGYVFDSPVERVEYGSLRSIK